MIPTTLQDDALAQVLHRLAQSNQVFSENYPGDVDKRQPVHTVYGGAHLFKSDTVLKLGQLALKALDESAPDFVTFAKALQLPGHQQLPDDPEAIQLLTETITAGPEQVRMQNPDAWLAYAVYQRTLQKLRQEPVEDFRIDFEDGFGNRSDDEEDQTAVKAAKELAQGFRQGTLSPYIGIRIKPFTEDLKARSIRTLDIFLTALHQHIGQLPPNFVVTLPKVTLPEQVSALADLFDMLESRLPLPQGSLKTEIMVETTQSLINAQGACSLPDLVRAGRGRCIAAHFGTYDFTASCNITAAYQAMDHPACDFARHLMKASLAGTGIWLSDGATNIMPVGPHRPDLGGAPLTPGQIRENRDAVYNAWRLGYRHIQHSLRLGFYQGWDLHPAQLPVRYAACYTFFLTNLAEATERLRNFVEKAAQATLAAGNVFDDAATAQGLLNYFLRAYNCGAVTESEIEATGLTLAEIQCRSFARIMEARRRQQAMAPLT